MAKILVVEDDKDTAKAVVDGLTSQHHVVEFVHDGQEGLDRLLQFSYDALVLDWNLPSMSGPEVCRRYRIKNGTARILLLTGRSDISEKEQGFDAGADDYLTKPFSVRELAARISALLRRSPELENQVLVAGDIALDAKRHEVTRKGQQVDLMPIDFALLEFFMRHPNEVFTADALIRRVWHTDKDIVPDAIRQAIRRLRQALDSDPEQSIIQNIHRIGYKFRM